MKFWLLTSACFLTGCEGGRLPYRRAVDENARLTQEQLDSWNTNPAFAPNEK